MPATRVDPVPLLQRALDASREPRQQPSHPPGIVRLYDFLPREGRYREEVMAGLAATPKCIPWKHMFDAAGLLLFERACTQPEYVGARTENALLHGNIGEIVEFIGGNCEFIELGRQGSTSADLLIEHLRPAIYVPIDGSRPVLEGASLLAARRFPWLHISALHADIEEGINLPRFVGAQSSRKAVFLLGGAMARFDVQAACVMLRRLRSLMASSGRALVAVDQCADEHILLGAYNDRAGAMAAFNLHVLDSINKKLPADFQIQRYQPIAAYDESQRWVELSLESQYAQFARVAGKRIDFAPGERVVTGIHRAYAAEEFQGMAREAGLRVEKTWTDTHQLYALHGLVSA